MSFDEVCVICRENTANFICYDCCLDELKIFLYSEGVELNIIKSIIQEMEVRLKGMSGEQFCIVCNQNSPLVCPRCFFLIAVSVIKQLSNDLGLVENFSEVFH